MEITDFILTVPGLRTDRRFCGLSTDTKPTILPDSTGMPVPVGMEFREEDTGKSFYFDGSIWLAVNYPQKIDQQVELLFQIRDLLQGLQRSDAVV